MATNMSFIGLESIFDTSEDFDSATRTPARNAPIATESPTMFASSAFEKIADSGVNYPCIIVSSEVFARLASVYGEGPLTVNVDLDILRDGTGNVFVDVKFSAADVHESFLIDAAKHTWFFHVLAESSLVGVAPKNADGRMFAVQLPKPDAAREALEKILTGLGK